MDNKETLESEIRSSISKINSKAIDNAPEPNWTGVLGKSENESLKKITPITTIKQHKWLSIAASVATVLIVTTTLVLALSNENETQIKTTNEKEKEATTTTFKREETTAPTVPDTTPTTNTTTLTSPTTTTPAALTFLESPSNPQLTGSELVGPPGDPATYNVYFSWNASSTPGVKYCVATTSVGSSQVFPNCSWNNPYLISSTSTGFGLVFQENTTYQFQVTAVDSNNRLSKTVYLSWQLP